MDTLGQATTEAASAGGRQLLSLLSSGDSNWRVLERSFRASRSAARFRFLVLIVVVVSVAMLIGNVYVIVFYQHPEAWSRVARLLSHAHAALQDRNQAWLPKIVVVLGLSLSFLSVLMLPLDVANRNACDQTKLLSACTYTLPMTDLWCVRWCSPVRWSDERESRTYVYITMIVWVSFVIPFTLFFYESDSEKCASPLCCAL